MHLLDDNKTPYCYEDIDYLGTGSIFSAEQFLFPGV